MNLEVTAWESTTNNTGALDRISVQLTGSGSIGLLFSSNWVSNTTKWQTLNGGKIQVRNATTQAPCTNCPSAITARTGELDKPAIEQPFNVKAFPNPSGDEFNVYLEGANNETVSLTLYDALGRQIKKFEKESGNIPIHFGRELKGGMYILEVRQGENHKSIKLVKQN